MIHQKRIQIIIHPRVRYRGRHGASRRTACSCKCNRIVRHWHGASRYPLSLRQRQSDIRWLFHSSYPLFSITSHVRIPPLSISSSNFVSLSRLFPSLVRLSGENDIIHHGIILYRYLFSEFHRARKTGMGKMKRGDHLEEGGFSYWRWSLNWIH